MNYDIELGQGDSDSIGVILKENGTAVNLTGATVKFVMQSDTGKTKYEITCTPGATIDGKTVLVSAGGVTIPFTSTHTATPGIFFGRFLVDLLNSQSTFPSSGNVRVRINKAP